MVTIKVPGRTFMNGFLCVCFISVLMGCGSPQDKPQRGVASAKEAQPGRNTKPENRSARSSETPPQEETASPRVGNPPLPTTREYVGPSPNLAYLEFLEALNTRYGTTIPSSTIEGPSMKDKGTAFREKKGETNEETRMLAQDGHGIVDSGGARIGSGD